MSLLALSAAHCILVSGLRPDDLELTGITIRKAVAKWQDSDRAIGRHRMTILLHRSYLQELLSSMDPADVAFAASLVPLGDFDSRQSHKLLMDTLRGNDNRLVVRACRDSLRNREGALDLITLAETDHICGLVQSRYHDVRLAAIKALGMLPNDEQVVSTLRSVSGMGRDLAKVRRSADELDQGIRALAEHARKDSALRRILVTDILSTLPDPRAQQFGDKQRQEQMLSMLVACEKIGGIVDESFSRRLLRLAKDFRTPAALRAQALRVYGRMVRPKPTSVAALMGFLRRDDNAMNEASYAAVFWFLAQCRKRVEYVRSVYAELPSLRRGLIRVWNREKDRVTDRIDSVGIEDIRRSLGELESLIISYAEFSERMKLTDDGSGE